MSDWLHNLPVPLMALISFGFTYFVAAAVYVTVIALADGKRAHSFKAVSAGMLPPLGILFGLFVAFTAAQVWSDNDRANAAVDREASALATIVALATSFRGDDETRLRALVRRHIEEAATREWPLMASGAETLKLTPGPLSEALQLTLALAPNGQGDRAAGNCHRPWQCVRRASAADYYQPVESQFHKMVKPVLAGDLRFCRDRHGPQR
jgi:hypothetical protein